MGKSICTVNGCGRKHYGHGMCHLHYQRAARAQELVPATPRSDIERFMEKVEIRSDGCWIWRAAITPKGYGQFRLGSGMKLAHRVAYELFIGPIPVGLELDHTCHTRDLDCLAGDACPHRRHVNPWLCLEPVTHPENAVRGCNGLMASALNAVKTHCPRGHAYDDENTYISHEGSRVCRACGREKARERRARRAQVLSM